MRYGLMTNITRFSDLAIGEAFKNPAGDTCEKISKDQGRTEVELSPGRTHVHVFYMDRNETIRVSEYTVALQER